MDKQDYIDRGFSEEAAEAIAAMDQRAEIIAQTDVDYQADMERRQRQRAFMEAQRPAVGSIMSYREMSAAGAAILAGCYPR